MPLLFLDTETYSEVNLKTQGTHRYAENAEIIMWQYAIDDGDVIVEDYLTPELNSLLIDPAYEIVIHNSHFDRTVIRHCAQIDLPVSRIFDTMACALAHSLPGSLDQLCDIFNIASDKAKDKEGKKLINLFCKPQKDKDKNEYRITKEERPDDWDKFRNYGRLDIAAMREICKILPRWNFKGTERKIWELDQRINDRGVCVDLELCHAAVRASSRAKKEYDDETFSKTGGEVTTTARRDTFLEHLSSAYGISLPDLTSARVKQLINERDLPEQVIELLEIRLQANKNSAAKYKAVIKAVSKDNRLRGLLQFCGASRTGRWSGRLFQPQNLSRPTISNAELESAILELKANAQGLI